MSRWVSLLAVAVLSGCAPSAGVAALAEDAALGEAAATPSVAVSAVAEAAPEPSAFVSYPGKLPKKDTDEAAVVEAFQQYWRIYEKYWEDPAAVKDYREIRKVAKGDARELVEDHIELWLDHGMVLRGESVFSKVKVKFASDDIAKLSFCKDASRFGYLFGPMMQPALWGDDIRPGTATIERNTKGVWQVASFQWKDKEC